MAIQRRKRADKVSNPRLPKLPETPPKDWPKGLFEIIRAMLFALEQRDDVCFGIQSNGTDLPLRAILNVVSGATVTDDQTNDRTNLTVP
jgi:hypothetical protein